MRFVPFLVVALGVLGCELLVDLQSFRTGLAREFQEPAVHVHHGTSGSGTVLTITFPNSRAGDLPRAEQAGFARRVAEYARDHYSRFEALDAVVVQFSRVRQTGPVTVTEARGSYRFTPAQLRAPSDSVIRVTL